MVSTNYQGLLISKVGNVLVDGYSAETVRDIKAKQEVKAVKEIKETKEVKAKAAATTKTVAEKIKEKKAKVEETTEA